MWQIACRYCRRTGGPETGGRVERRTETTTAEREGGAAAGPARRLDA